MPFIANVKKSGIELAGTGSLDIVSGKCRVGSKVLKKGEQPTSGLEMILSINDSQNIKFVKWEKDGERMKQVEDLSPKVYPLTVSAFLPETEELGQAFLVLFDPLMAKELTIPENIMNGFNGKLELSENKFTTMLAAKSLGKVTQIISAITEDLEACECKLEFPTAPSGGYGGSGGQTQAQITATRVEVIDTFLKGDKAQFVQLSVLDESLTVVQYLTLILG
jgi:hypothetical protein